MCGTPCWSRVDSSDGVRQASRSTQHGDLDDVIAGYGSEVDRDIVRAWWSLRCLLNVRWLADHGFGAPDDLPEVAVLRRP